MRALATTLAVLTRRERDVLLHVAEGADRKEVGQDHPGTAGEAPCSRPSTARGGQDGFMISRRIW